jgi:hypothetical protein
MDMKKILYSTIAIIPIIVILAFTLPSKTAKTPVVVTNFAECAALGNPVMESYPRQCRAGDKTFAEDVGNIIAKMELIRLETPQPGAMVSSPLTIKGEARGSWFFEASFPVVITNWDGLIIGEGVAQAQGDWMTTDFVPFTASLTFTADPAAYSDRGTLILRKDNPSGLPANDDALEIPVIIDSGAGL